MADPSLAAAHPPAPEACPPPLAWQEVLQGVEEDGESFAISTHGFDIQGVVLGDGPPLWFLNGFAGDRRLFSLLAWLLRDRFRCVLSDVTWTGSPAPVSFVASYSESLLEAMTALQMPRAGLFGTSFGAQVALAMMKTAPDRIRGAILHEGFARRKASLTERLVAWGAGHSGKTLAEAPSWVQIQESNHRQWFPPIDPSRWNFLLDALGRTSAGHWSMLARAATATNFGPELQGIKTPVLLVRTEGDGPVATAAMNELAVSLPNVREETLHTSGHFAFLTHPHRVGKIVASFLGGLE